MHTLTLASASPARLGLLRACGIEPAVLVSDVDETAVEARAREGDPAITPGEVAQLLAEAKGADVAPRAGSPGPVLACDSVLELDGEIFGKPHTAARARERWTRMRGRTGVLHTGHWLTMTDGAGGVGPAVGRSASARVTFADVGDAEIEGYIATGEPLHVAGGFTIDGRGAPFVEGVEGHPSTVVGMCLPLLRTMLAELGTAWWDLAVPS